MTTPYQQAALAPMGAVRITAGQGEQILGQAIAQIGQQMAQVKTAREVAEGVAEYNTIVEEYKSSLAEKDPTKYGYVEHFDKLQTSIGKITKGKSRAASQELQNKFTVWNSSNRAAIGKTEIDRTISMTREQADDVMLSFARNGQREEAESHLNQIASALRPGEKEKLMYSYETHEIREEVSKIINANVFGMGSPQGFDVAMELVKGSALLDSDKTKLYNAIRSAQGSERSRSDIAYKVGLANNMSQITAAVTSGQTYTGEVFLENEGAHLAWQSRAAHGTTEISDGQTYRAMEAEILTGKLYSPYDIDETRLRDLTSEEYKKITQLNNENSKLTDDQKDSLAQYSAEISTRYTTLFRPVQLNVSSPQAKALLAATMVRHKRQITNEVRSMVRAGATPLEINQAIEAHFIGDTRGMFDGWFTSIFQSKRFETKPEYRNETDPVRRMDILFNMTMAGEADRAAVTAEGFK